MEEAEADSAARKAAAAADGDGAAEEAEESGFEATEAVFDGSTGGNPLPPKEYLFFGLSFFFWFLRCVVRSLCSV